MPYVGMPIHLSSKGFQHACMNASVKPLIWGVRSAGLAASVGLAETVYGVSANVILDSACRAITSWDIVTSCIKSWVFGTIIAVVCTPFFLPFVCNRSCCCKVKCYIELFLCTMPSLVFASMLHIQSSAGRPSSWYFTEQLRQYATCVNDLQVSCSWGFTTTGGAKGVGESTTSAVVISLVLIFIADFILSFLFFQGQGDALKQCM